MSNEIINIAIERAKLLDIDNYYIGAGCITQTVWNYLSNNPLEYGIKDIDFVYFDGNNLGSKSENIVISKVKDLYSDLKIELDVKNQEEFIYGIKVNLVIRLNLIHLLRPL